MNKFLLSFSFAFAYSFVSSQCITNVDFNTWVKGGQPGNGNWVVQGGGSQVHQTINGDPTFYLSPYNLMNVHLSGNFKTTDGDDDWMGFVFSYQNPMGATDSFDCWLFDWKQKQQGGASSGKSLCRVDGVIPPGMYNTTFWNHQNTPEFTVVQNTFGGAGWIQGNNHAFELYLTYTRAIIYVDGVKVFDQQDCFHPGRFGFYNYSQKDCYYSNFQYDLYVDFNVPPQICLGDPIDIEFVNQCANGLLNNYQSATWDFGDGTVITNNNPSFANINVQHVYTQPGNYTISLSMLDINGCSATKTHTVQVGSPIVLSPTLTQPLCNGGSNGGLAVAASGGFGNYTYSWNGGNIVGPSYVGATAGTYTVTATDGVCVTSAQYTLNQPPPLTASVTSTDASCNQNNGTASISIAGGTPPYQGVNWAGIPGANATGLAPGYYIADFTDANGCSASLQYNGGSSVLQYTATIAQLPCGYTLSASATNQHCANVNDGTATVTVTGGVSPIAINWSNGGSGATITGLAPGNYTYNYTDGNSQHFTGTVTVNPAIPMLVDITTSGISCPGINDGQALASVTSGGVPSYTYTWSGGHPNNPLANGLSPGIITVTVTDANTCSATASDSISAMPSLNIDMFTINDSCYHAGKGSILTDVEGGTPPYSYAWSNFSSDTANTHLIAGTYTLTVTDDKGCSTTATSIITGPPPLTYSVVDQDIGCYGDTTGGIHLAVSGGTSPYNYAWSPALGNNETVTNLAAGIYNYTVTDQYSCTFIGSDTLLQPDSALVATSSHTNVTCHGANDGTVTINISGGTPPYTYMGNPIPGGTNTLSGLAPNTYAGSVSDANGCNVALSETITEPGPQSLTLSATDATCNGAADGTATANFVNPTGIVTYNWSPGGIQPGAITNLTAGTYNVTATDANNCSFTDSATVNQPSAITFNIVSTPVKCYGDATGSFAVSTNGGVPTYTYTWNPSSATGSNPSNLTAGVYSLTITDANTCTVSSQDSITQPAAALSATSSHTDVTCHGANDGKVILNLSGGTTPYTFMGNPIPAGSDTLSGLAPNTYAGAVTDANGCSVALSETITEPGPQSLTLTSTDASCNGAADGTATANFVNPTGSVTYNWNPGGVQPGAITNLTAGVYNVTATDANNCSFSDSATINEPAAPIMTVATTDALCFGATGSATANPSGGTAPYTYSWSGAWGNLQTVAPTAGTYTVSASDANSCNQTASFTINAPTQIMTSETHSNNLCFGSSTALIAVAVNGGTPGYTYVWNPNVSNSDSALNISAGNYSVTVTDANNCTATQMATVTEPTQLTVSAVETDLLCKGDNSGTITANGAGGVSPYTYSATDGTNSQPSASGQFTGQSAGSYTVYVADQNNCTDSTSITINEPNLLTTVLTPTDVTCYHYTDGQLSVSSSGGTPLYTYTFSNGVQNSSGIQSNLGIGNYSVTVTDAHNCSTTQSGTIAEPDSVSINVLPTAAEVNLGESLPLQVSTNLGGTASYVWEPSFGLSCYDCDQPVFNGNYSVTYRVSAVTSAGCMGVSSVTITVIPKYDIFVPNAFTPNGDGTNDVWKMFGNLPGIKQIHVMVFNRIGEKVFDTTDINFEWDGTYKGVKAPSGVYIYTASFVWLNNHTDNTYKGSLTILR